MTFGRLQSALAAIGIDATPQELAELVWLASLAPASDTESRPEPGEPLARPESFDEGVDDPPPTAMADPPTEAPTTLEPGATEPDGAKAYLPPAQGAAEGGGTLPLRLPSVAALPDALDLAKSLRPFNRRVPSRHARVVDEPATAQAVAEQKLWLPVFSPGMERWLDLALVVDENASMTIWRRTVAELELLLGRQGAFRDVRTWRMDTSDTARPRLYSASRASAPRDPRELVAPAGRRVILLVSDGVGAAWHSPRMMRTLSRWAAASPLAIAHTLPPRLWPGSAVNPVPVRLRATVRGAANSHLSYALRAPRPLEYQPSLAELPVPVLDLEPAWLGAWASLVAGADGGWTNLAAILVDGERRWPPAPDPGEPGLLADAADLIRRFRAMASPSAYELAGYLSAVPLSLPVMRLVQRLMVPGSRPADLAEIFLGGLLRRMTPQADPTEPDEVQYDFVAGAREILLSTLAAGDAVRLLDEVSRHLDARFGQGVDFRAVLADPRGAGGRVLEHTSLPFARVARLVLHRLGGAYADLSDRLAMQSADWAARETSDRTGIEDPAEPLQSAPTAPPALAEQTRPRREVHDRPVRHAPLRIVRPLLFVGLGGTGLSIGAALERRLRREICGPDGTAWAEAEPSDELLPYELPRFLQFVYADVNGAELERMPTRVVPGRTHVQAASRTQHLSLDLVPRFDSYLQLARSLRVRGSQGLSWLPPRASEPRVVPLLRGTGQLPTVSRAALFDLLGEGLQRAQAPIHAALDRIEKTRQVLQVYVAFSVAGGTGTGLFYDYLHLIGHALESSGRRARILPLVVLPSAFREGMGGGRRARLNAGSAIADLCHLIDGLNDGGSEVDYPAAGRVSLRPGAVPIAFLFGQSPGRHPGEVFESVAATALAMQSGEHDSFSFMDALINRTLSRQTVAESGIGARSLSTVVTRSLSVPVAELTRLISLRLFAAGVNRWCENGKVPLAPPPNADALRMARLGAIVDRPQERFPEPEPARGRAAIESALRVRRETMLTALDRQTAQVIPDEVSRAAADLDLGQVVRYLLGHLDPIAMRRVMMEEPVSADRTATGGLLGLLRARTVEPSRPASLTIAAPPGPAQLPGRLVRRLTWSDPMVQNLLKEQDAWYRWRVALAWNNAWHAHWATISRAVEREATFITEWTQKILDEQRNAAQTYPHLEITLADRPGVYLPLTPRLSVDDAINKMINVLGRENHRRVIREDDILDALLDPDDWQASYKLMKEQNAAAAIAVVMERFEQRCGQLLARISWPPTLTTELSDTVYDRQSQSAHRLETALASLVTANSAPPGHGPLHIMVTYPSARDDRAKEEFLGRHLQLPQAEFVPSNADTITVTQYRTNMGLTETPEAREVLREWSAASRKPMPDDYLDWRQRLGYGRTHLAMTERDQARVLHHILCAAWNGQVEPVDGDRQSPAAIRINVGVSIRLLLRPLDGVSSWSGLTEAYEDWILADQDRGVNAAAQLMRVSPNGLDDVPALPSELFLLLMSVASEERNKVSGVIPFWTRIFPDAMGLAFASTASFARDLNDLLYRTSR